MILYPPIEPFLQPKDTGLLFSDSFDNVHSSLSDGDIPGLADNYYLAAINQSKVLYNEFTETSWGTSPKIFIKNSFEGNYIIEFELRLKYTASYGTFYWRWLDSTIYGSSSGYRMQLVPEQSKIYVQRYVSGTAYSIGTITYTAWDINNYFRMSIEVNGSTFKFYHNDRLINVAVDNTFKSGGLIGFGVIASRLNNIKVVRM